MKEFVTVKRFLHELPFQELLQILKKKSIPYQTESYGERIDAVSMITLAPEYIVKVSSDQFGEVYEILNELSAQEVLNVDSAHYLFEFSDEELYSILTKPDEWSVFDYQLAQKILKDRGKLIDNEFLSVLRKARIGDLSKPEKSQKGAIWFGYLSSMLGGIIGIGIGWNMMSSKRILPNGDQIFSYGETDRRHGRNMLILGVVMIVVLLIFQIYKETNP